MSWPDLSEWWIGEVSSDPAYEEVVTPLLFEILQPNPGDMYLDLGCGEGRVARSLRELGCTAHCLDLSEALASKAGVVAVVGDMTTLPFEAHVYDGVFSVLSLEHVPDHGLVFLEAARATKSGGHLAVVMNHPIWTAPDSTPITDTDGEVLWRPGGYFDGGSSEVLAGDSSVTFHHRSTAALLNSAANAGWSLETLIERPHHEIENQRGVPRLLACRWRLLP